MITFFQGIYLKELVGNHELNPKLVIVGSFGFIVSIKENSNT